MKKLLLLVLLCHLAALPLLAQSKMACCAKPAPAAEQTATAKFAVLSTDPAFVAKHPSPLPYTIKNGSGKMVTFATPGGKPAHAYYIASPKKTNNYVLVVHEWWGLNDYIKQTSELLSQELGNVNVLALDIYDGKVASTQEQARQYMQEVTESRAKAIINGALMFAGDEAAIATIGWCFGGGWSLQAAIMAGAKAEAAVMFYGMPEQSEQRLSKLQAPVLGIFARQDAWITPEVVQEFTRHMAQANKKVTVKMYDADHAFANPSSPSYKSAYAHEAHQLAVSFIKKHL